MGGINHQPCREYLPDSTKLSRAMSLGRESFETANVCLEDLILAEINGERGDLEEVLSCLTLSCTHLMDMHIHLSAIETRYNANGGWEPPTTRSVSWQEVGTALQEMGAVEQESWDRMSAIRSRASFAGIIAHYREGINELRAITSVLRDSIEKLRPQALVGTLEAALEENRAGQLKISFAQLYTRWNSFQQDFLASSLLSTESWYAWTKKGSLVSIPCTRVA